jgi:hypothetical protein
MADPNYKVIELEAENDNLKDQIIKLLHEKIDELEQKLAKYEIAIIESEPEKDTSSHMVDSRPVIRTISELSQMLEVDSLRIKKQFGEDVPNA